MKTRWTTLGLVVLLVALFFVGRLGSVTFALAIAGLIAVLLLITFVTRPRSGLTQQKEPPTRADAELQRWDVGGF
jgi:O-antigen ligase